MSDKKRAALLDPDVRAKKLKVQRERQAISRSLRQNKQGRKPLAKVGKGKVKRMAGNKAYYASAEWREKKRAVHERDDFQCVEKVKVRRVLVFEGEEVGMGKYTTRCPNRGEVVNGKQTARGLVAEEEGYQHRGVAGSIDRIKTRCKDCDRRLTPLERVNHTHGFNNQRHSA